jgi:hypothetical protein
MTLFFTIILLWLLFNALYFAWMCCGRFRKPQRHWRSMPGSSGDGRAA